jgi:hypothetical protein
LLKQRLQVRSTWTVIVPTCSKKKRRISKFIVKVKLKVIAWHACAGTEERRRYSSKPFATSALERGGRVSTTLRSLYPREWTDPHCAGGWVDLWADVDGCGRSRPQGGFDFVMKGIVINYNCSHSAGTNFQLLNMI